MWIYKKNKDNSARYVLGEEGTNPLICFGINPSTAEPNKLDNTLTQVKSISSEHNYDGWIMLNLYPQRATNPKNIHQEMDVSIHSNNLRHIQNIFSSNSHTTIWAAWGGLINQRHFLKDCLRDVVKITRAHSLKWFNKGDLLQQGHPHHPLYLKKKTSFQKFNIEKYLKCL